MAVKPLVSVVITTKNEEKNIRGVLRSIWEQSYKNIETIVVDNNSTDQTLKIAEKFTKKLYLKGPERSTQRNFAVEKSRGEYVLILDADMVLTRHVVRDCVELCQGDGFGAVIIPERSFGIGFWAKAKSLEREINRGEEYFEAARFFPKKVFNKMGGYDTSLTGPEDWDLPQRISFKYKIGRIRSVIYHNEGKPTLYSLMKRKYYYGLSAYKYLRKHSIPLLGARTVYFLRPAFYKRWRWLLTNPLVTIGMIVMLCFENVAGGMGYIWGRVKNDS